MIEKMKVDKNKLEDTLVERMKLENGLTLEVLDHSRHVAGDRWLVSFEARVAVAVTPEYLPGGNASDPPITEILSLLGEKAIYSHKKARNFIAEKEKEKVFEDLKKLFLDASLGYLSSPRFPRMLILRKYKEARSRQDLLQKQQQHAALLGE